MNLAALLLGVASASSAGVDLLLSSRTPQGPFAFPTVGTIVLEWITAGIALIYGTLTTAEYPGETVPLGIKLLCLEFYLLGVVLIGFAFWLFFLPILGIVGIGMLLLGLGTALIYLGRSLWSGKVWAFHILTVLTIIGVIASFVQLFLLTANPILALYQIWYLRRPHVHDFFEGGRSPTLTRTAIGARPAFPATLTLQATKKCRRCGTHNPETALYCNNCGERVPSADSLPVSRKAGEIQTLHERLRMLESDIRRMDEMRKAQNLVNPEMFEKTYSAKVEQSEEIRQKLRSLETQAPS